MVDVGEKPETQREASARACVVMQAATADVIRNNAIPKGDVFAVARVAGIIGAKRTADLIPLCHPIPITSVDIRFCWPDVAEDHPAVNAATEVRLQIDATVRTFGRTGVEMEALTAVSAGALAIYDMCKAIDRGMVIRDVSLRHKSGGRSGTFNAPD